MTRASLLHILNHVSEISDAETRELEQLAAAFPYCQTAHVLLAKAAHDRGSMLASQRLRRAATYAANRDLLRQLLETPAPSVRESAPVLEQSVHDAAVATTLAEATPEAVTEPEADQLPTTPQEALAESRPAADPEQEAADHLAPSATEPELAEPALTEPDEIFEAYLPLASEDLLVIPATSEQEQPEQRNDHTPALSPGTDTDDTSVETASIETVTFISEETEVILLPIAQHEAEAPTTEVNQQEEPAHVVPSLGVEGDGAAETLATQLSEQTTSVGEEAATVGEQALELFPVVDDLLPATAPPIRPPVEAGISRLEFGLVEPALPPPSSYQLLGLEDDDEPSTVPGELPRAEIPPFRADEQLGYALSAGSRFGYDLEPHDGYTLNLPADAFFEPDPLLLAYLKANRPKPSASSIDLINRFLQAKPRIKTTTGPPPPTATEQDDLSVRSTRPAPTLASESLAKIMVKQGKTDKAIEIYEVLMQRQPEKMAYFADLIQQLKQPSE